MSLSQTPSSTQSLHLERPETARNGRIFWPYLTVFLGFHALALLAFHPYFFSWTGVVLVFVGNYLFGSMGINVGYHRLLTHRGFTCPKWLERFFALLGVCSLQDSPGRWVAIHRMHHQRSDTQPDPHSPWVNFIWGHFGWLIVENREIATLNTFSKYAPDVFQDRFYRWLLRKNMWVYIYIVHAVILILLGYLAGWLIYGTWEGTARFGSSILVWGVIVRTVYVWHITWAVNSAAHLWGYRNYETGERSRNNWWVALATNGEGWHNNHHADPRSAAHGHRWWELDITYLTLLLLGKIGLIKDIVKPRVNLPAVKKDGSGPGQETVEEGSSAQKIAS